LLVFTRTNEEETILCYFTLSDHPVNATVPPGNWVTVGGELGSIRPMPDHTLHLGPWQPSILRLDEHEA
ncbi:MAG: alpha-glucosidase, partial [Thioclava sp.]